MSQPRQILHLISNLDGYSESQQLRLLVEKQLADGTQVRVTALSTDGEMCSALAAAGAVCRELERRWKYDPVVAWRLARELRRQPHDILHVWGVDALRHASFVRPDSLPTPCVATLAPLPRWQFCLDADCFTVANSREQSDEKMIVIPPGVAAPAPCPPQRANFCEHFSLPTDARVIALAGRLTRDKRLEEAIWCFELVRTLDEQARLLIFGDGSDRHRLERFARLASEPSQIQFLGYRDDFKRWLPHVDVFWQPAGGELDTGYPQAMLEAMAAKVPIVAAERPTHRQIIDDGHTGYLFPVGSRAICARHTLRLIQDKGHSSTLAAAAAKEVAARFSIAAFADAYAELYKRLMAEKICRGHPD